MISSDMGCNASDANGASTGNYANRSPSQDCLTDDKKTKIKKLIQKDAHADLALFLADKCKHYII